MADTTLKVIRGVCPHDCPDTCSFVTTVDETTGKAVDFRGNKNHPFTRGFLCNKVSRYLERTYHQDRILYPMKRVGAKGSGQFVRISWDEALQEISTRLREICTSSNGPQAILPYSYGGTLGQLQSASVDRRFFHALGASLLDRTICSTAGEIGCDITLGTRAVINPEDVIHSRLIINWGSNTSVTNSHLWSIMHRARTTFGARIITIDPHRSKTASRSDQWIPVRPGTDGALALGLMHVLAREELWDQDYVSRFCHGGEELRSRVLEDYAPEKVAQICQLPTETIENLALEYGRCFEERGGPPFIRLNYGLQRHGGGAMAVRNVCCLPALVGAWKYQGGGALLSTSRTFPFNNSYLCRPDLIPAGTRTINMVQLAEALEGKLPGPPVKSLIVYNANPATVCPDQNRVIQGLQREDLFTVVLEQFPTDTTDYADILLPATTQLEHLDLHGSYGHLYVQLNRPALTPLGESLPNTEIFRRLGLAMNLPREHFEENDETLARGALQAVSTKRLPAPDAFSGIDFERLWQEGWARLNYPEDWRPFAQGNFLTASGRCELYSLREEAAGRDPLPHYIPPHEDPQTQPQLASRYPLQMITPPVPEFLNSTFAHLQSQRDQAGEPTVELHPRDAESRKITSGEYVRIFNDRGDFRARAVVGESVPPGVAATFGCWWRKQTADRQNCNVLTSTALTDQGGAATFFDNMVQIEKYTPA